LYEEFDMFKIISKIQKLQPKEGDETEKGDKKEGEKKDGDKKDGDKKEEGKKKEADTEVADILPTVKLLVSSK